MSEAGEFSTARQLGLYSGRRIVPVRLDRLRREARAAMSDAAAVYVNSGAGGHASARANRRAFQAWQIMPRMLRKATQRDHAIEICGTRFAAPLLLAPVGLQSLLHPEGDLPAARAAAARGIGFMLSTVAARRMEEVAAAGPGPRWFQLYRSCNPEVNQSLLQRAERAGYGAVVVTVDLPQVGWREHELEFGDLAFLRGEGLANYFSDPAFRGTLARPPEEDMAAAVAAWRANFSNPALSWADLAALRAQTKLPILVKGIQHADDAAAALDAGMDGIVVSNHGGRQVEGAIGSLAALPEVVARVAGRVPVLFDSGIRRGADAVKALALGARAVLIGRLFLWGLALGGEAGVGEVLDNFLADYDLTLGLSGYRNAGELTPESLRPV